MRKLRTIIDLVSLFEYTIFGKVCVIGFGYPDVFQNTGIQTRLNWLVGQVIDEFLNLLSYLGTRLSNHGYLNI